MSFEGGIDIEDWKFLSKYVSWVKAGINTEVRESKISSRFPISSQSPQWMFEEWEDQGLYYWVEAGINTKGK